MLFARFCVRISCRRFPKPEARQSATMSDYDVDDDGSNDAQDYEENITDEGESRERISRTSAEEIVILDTEDASETDMLKYEGEYTEIKEQ